MVRPSWTVVRRQTFSLDHLVDMAYDDWSNNRRSLLRLCSVRPRQVKKATKVAANLKKPQTAR